MIKNRTYLIISTIYLVTLGNIFFYGLGELIYQVLTLIVGSASGLMAIRYASLAVLGSFLGIPISWIVFFLTNKFLYKKLKADFNFTRPVLYTSIIIFVIGQILFYLSLVAWSSFRWSTWPSGGRKEIWRKH